MQSVVSKVARRSKIALVVDVDHWAFANTSRQLLKHLNREFEFCILAYSDFGTEFRLLLSTDEFDLVHVFWRPILKNMIGGNSKKRAEQLGIKMEELIERKRKHTAITTAVFDHLFLSGLEIEDFAFTLRSCDAYTVSSEKLNAIYSNIAQYPPPTAIITDGVDLDRFRPKNLSRFLSSQGRPLRIGWCGNSDWGWDGRDFKGLTTIIRPALQTLRQSGIETTEFIADRQQRWRSHSRDARLLRAN